MLVVLRKQLQPKYLIAHIILLGGGLILVYPLVFMAMASLSQEMNIILLQLVFFQSPKNQH